MENEAWNARCLLRSVPMATLATQAQGQPFAALVTPAISPAGAVLMLLSSMSTHSGHLAADPRCAVLLAGPPADLNPQTALRLSLVGEATPCPDRALHARWLARHPYARLYADFADFQLWRMVPAWGQFIGGFASATRLDASRLAPAAAAVQAMEEAEPGIVAECNADHADTIARLAHAQGARGRWSMIAMDCDGFDLLQDETVLRVAFDAPVQDLDSARAGLARLAEATRPGRW